MYDFQREKSAKKWIFYVRVKSGEQLRKGESERQPVREERNCEYPAFLTKIVAKGRKVPGMLG